MSVWSLDVGTAFRLGGFIYLVMPATVWVVLRGRHERSSLIAWCVGAAAYGLAYLLIGMRGMLPDWVSIYLANMVLLATYPLRVAALRMEMGARLSPALGMLLLVLGILTVLLADAVSAPARVLATVVLQFLGTAWLAWTAMVVWKATSLRSVRMIGLAYALFTLAQLHVLASTGFSSWTALFMQPTVAVALSVMAGFVAALYGNLGFIGMALERSHAQELANTEALARESAQRLAAEKHSLQLRAWLDEREELLSVLAHEVRQPLNNATAALQSAYRALTPSGTDSQAASLRVQRAEGVLRQIIGTLDNTLAATALLASPDRVARRDVDVDTLLALSVGDLEVSLRPRVRIEKLVPTRTALMDAGLMRLALRNLLSNALAYSPPDSPVVLRITDSDEPLALVFEVIDQGQGVDSALAARLFERGVRGDHGRLGHGLGLYVVRRVMELHGGSVDQRPNPEVGSTFRLLLLQDVAEGRA